MSMPKQSNATKGRLTRRGFLKAALAAAGGAAALAAEKVLAFDYLTPISDPLGNYPYEYRAWESFYKDQWAFTYFGRAAHSANCTGNCTWKGYVRDGVLYKEEQFADYPDIGATVPTYNPRGCQKGANYKEYIYGPQRIKYPLIRADYNPADPNPSARGQGRFRRATWDEALNLIASKVVQVIQTPWNDGGVNRAFSPDQLFFYAAIPAKHHITLSGGFRLANLIGAPIGSFYDWYCDNPPGQPMTWGVQTDACESADWFNSTFIMIQGANLTETRIPDAHYFHEARAKGCKTVVVAPEHNPVAIHADLFLPIQPGTDGAFCLGMCHVILNEGSYQADYLKQFTDMPLLVYTSGPNRGKFVRTDQNPYVPHPETGAPNPNPPFSEFRAYSGGTFVIPPTAALDDYVPELAPGELVYTDGETVKTVFQLLSETLAAYSPAAVEAITGISQQTIIDMAREFANHSAYATRLLPEGQRRAGRIIEGAGTNHYYHNDLINRAQILVLALTGNVGYPGAGFDHYVGQEKLWGEEGFFRLSFPYGRARQRFQPTTLWSFVHSGTTSDVDGELPRPVSQYIAESVSNGWMPLWPKGTLTNGRAPKVMFVWGANYLNQAKGQTKVIDTLWPKLDLVVDINFQMDTTARFADVVLPAASFFEKFDLNTSDLTTFVIPFTPVIDPLFESRTDWQIWRSLAQAIQNTGFAGFTDDFAPFGGNHYPTGLPVPPLTRDFTTLVNQFDTWASPTPALSPANYPPITTLNVAADRDACQWLLDNSPEMSGLTIHHPGLEGTPIGDYRFTDPAQLNLLPENSIIKHPQRFITASEEWTSDILPGVPYYCFQRMTEHLHPLKTMTGRQQFYHDHAWMLELGEQLPVHKGPIDADNPALYPLRWITPHGRWSIHSTWRNAKFQLRLQRGRPVVYLSPAEAAARGLRDNDLVTVYNAHGSLDAYLYISPRMPNGMALMYHGWEGYTMPGGAGWQSPVTIRIKPTQLIGRYGQLNFRLNYFGPTGNQKDTRVEITLKQREPDNSLAPWP